jgi:predicted kinase
MKTLSLSQPHLLIVVGIPGSGKSFFAEKFAATFQAPYIDYATIMDISAHNTTTSDIYAGYFLRELFKTNHTLVFDGPSNTKAERAALRDLASAAGYKPLYIWVQTDIATAKSRYIKISRKLGQHVTGSQYDSLMRQFTAPDSSEQPVVVISGKHTYATQAKAVLKNLVLDRHAITIERPQKPIAPHSGKRNITIQ